MPETIVVNDDLSLEVDQVPVEVTPPTTIVEKTICYLENGKEVEKTFSVVEKNTYTTTIADLIAKRDSLLNGTREDHEIALKHQGYADSNQVEADKIDALIAAITAKINDGR
jgi:hypothetical protein